MLVEKIQQILSSGCPAFVTNLIVELIRILTNILFSVFSVILSLEQKVRRNNYLGDSTESIQKQNVLHISVQTCLVSIIIPAFNVSDTITRCIDSVVKDMDSYSTKFEVIVVNDGSTDETSSVLEQYESIPYIKVYHKVNGGLSSARNYGIARSHGKYVYFLDSDDYLLPSALGQMLRGVASNADLIQFSFQRVQEDMKLLGVDRFMDQTYKDREIFDEPWSGYPWGKLIRTTLMMPYGFPEGYWFEDTVFPATVFPRTKIYVTASFVIQAYVDNPKGITRTSKFSPKTLDHVKVVRLLFKQQRELGIKRGNSENVFWQAHLSTKAYGRVRKLSKANKRKMLHEIHRLVGEYPGLFEDAPRSFRSAFLLRTINSENLLGWTLASMIG
ncbi:glycosyltransferase family 2 protein [Lacticaseibacillus paracasei]|uniref:glycosyltransferase family 2 protein n=1 Tax=Lacticaseibacillus paracasei TaxID=1597 RepID=UPI00404638D1